MLVPIPGLRRRVRSQASENAAACARSAHHGGTASPPTPTVADRLQRPDLLIQARCKRLPEIVSKQTLLRLLKIPPECLPSEA